MAYVTNESVCDDNYWQYDDRQHGMLMLCPFDTKDAKQ